MSHPANAHARARAKGRNQRHRIATDLIFRLLIEYPQRHIRSTPASSRWNGLNRDAWPINLASAGL